MLRTMFGRLGKVALGRSLINPSRTVQSIMAVPTQFQFSQQRFATLNQIKRGGGKHRRNAKETKSPALEECPIRKGVVVRVMILKPKKPNSAQRKACRVRLSTGKMVSAYIPGEGHNAQEHSVVYVRGGRVQDLPGVKYHLVRGAMDLSGVANKTTARSKYGVKKPQKS